MDSMAPLPDLVIAPTLVRLPANGTTAAAEDLRNELVFAAVQGRGIELDASEVQNVGQAVLQLLVAARRDAVASGTALSFRDVPAAFSDRVRGCRLSELTGLDAGKDDL